MQTTDDVITDGTVAFHHAVERITEPIGKFLSQDRVILQQSEFKVSEGML